MNDTILISAVGRGQKDESGTAYQRTIYAYGATAYPPTTFFCDIVRQRERPQRIHLIGTATSSWSALLDERAGAEELWLALEEATEGPKASGADPALLDQLAACLTRTWESQVSCTAVCHRDVDDGNADAVVARLLLLLPQGEERLILDVTHGFRSLPMLAMAAIQISEGMNPGLFARTSLVYGDLVKRGENGGPASGAVRSLDRLRELARIAHAAAAFNDTLDGDALAEAIAPQAPATAAALRSLSSCIAANFFDHIDERVRQLDNARCGSELDGPVWGGLVRSALGRLIAALSRPRLEERLLALADLRIERGQYGPAVMALAEAATALACPEPVSFSRMQDAVRDFAQQIEGEDRRRWHDLHRLRNRMAHGAGLVADDWDLTEQSLAHRVRPMRRLIAQLVG